MSVPERVIPSDVCGLCNQLATGLAAINDIRYCHGDDDSVPTCYQRALHSALDSTQDLLAISRGRLDDGIEP